MCIICYNIFILALEKSSLKVALFQWFFNLLTICSPLLISSIANTLSVNLLYLNIIWIQYAFWIIFKSSNYKLQIDFFTPEIYSNLFFLRFLVFFYCILFIFWFIGLFYFQLLPNWTCASQCAPSERPLAHILINNYYKQRLLLTSNYSNF
jgi:hypothetical protein